MTGDAHDDRPRESKLERTIAGSALSAVPIVAESQAMRLLLQQARKLAATDNTVLLQGESGTGKDLLASFIHHAGPRAAAPLVTIDCAGLPHELFESELFGYERGAFTGASQMKRGRFELAAAGTLVLDEVASLHMAAQPKLLRALEDRSFYRLGGNRAVRYKARIIALSNIDLEQAVAERRFRPDLLYRLNVVTLELPPLRERKEDILPLAQHLFRELAENCGRKPPQLAPDAAAALRDYSFPGNVRELRNILERALLAEAGDTISAAALPPLVKLGAAVAKTLEEVEREHIAAVLDLTRGRKSRAAELLGITRKTLLEKRKKFDL